MDVKQMTYEAVFNAMSSHSDDCMCDMCQEFDLRQTDYPFIL